ncbi:endonuclease III [Candidatus Woesearchaeota archaeon]|nr:endonuclease III [Candidatus Woesearchaeota archaeon]
MDVNTLIKILNILEKEVKNYKVPIITLMSQRKQDPYQILIGTILSLRTKDEVTAQASQRLFAKAATPKEMLTLTEEQIEKLIYPVGFYKNKSKSIKEISNILLEKYNSKVPDDLDELLKFPGVGRKTANLVLIEGFNKPGVCVDVHNHRILNRFGFLKTKNPEETEFEIRKKLSQEYWKTLNFILVAFGQNTCVPVSPFCSRCPVNNFCEKKGVIKSR